jgi:putative transposase
MNYQLIEHHKREFPIVLLCNVLGVSESGFYAWRKRPSCQRQREDARQTSEIRPVFAGHQGRYGSPRIHREAIRSEAKHVSQARGQAGA